MMKNPGLLVKMFAPRSVILIIAGALPEYPMMMEPQRARDVTQNDARINSRIEKLERFKDWVFDDVLPTVRKYGCYPKPSIKEQIKMLSENLTSSDIDEKECYDKTYQIKRNDCRKGTNL